MISQIFDSNAFKIIALFALSPGSKFRRKELQEKIKMNNVPLEKALSRLIVSGIVRKEKNLYFLNFENPETEKIISIVAHQYHQLKNLPFGVYILILDIISEISEVKNIEVWLFGSYSKLIYLDKSDIDIAVLAAKGFEKKPIEKIFRKIENKYNKETEVHYFELSSFYKNKKDPLVKDILKNGIRLV